MDALVQKGVIRTLFSMAVPMLAGTFAMNAYNLTDTWFVSRLGTLPLAAMGFTFPVVMLITCVGRGIGSGVTTLAAHAMGRKNHLEAERFIGQGMIMGLVVTILLSILGYLLINPVFRLLGADDKTLPLIGEYMRTWYVGTVFMTIPMLAHGTLIAVGDSRAVSRLIVLGTVLNVILDPIFIFGFLGIPAMGIQGAALATVIAQTLPVVWLMHLLIRKHYLLTRASVALSDSLVVMRRISQFAIPGFLSMILMPISASVITKILSSFGHEAVAATGAAGRLEMFAFMVPMALGISLTPFVSQNFGAERLDRLRYAQKVSTLFALGYGGFITCLFYITAPWLAAAFTEDPKVTEVLVTYIRIVAFGYGMMEVHRYCTFFLTGMHKPMASTCLNAIRVLIFLVPLSYLGAYLGGINGVFIGRLATDLIVGAIGIVWVVMTLKKDHTPSSHSPSRSDSHDPEYMAEA